MSGPDSAASIPGSIELVAPAATSLRFAPWIKRGIAMKREIIRVEPLATYLERWKAPTSTVIKYGNTLYVTGAPPFEPETGEIFGGDIRRQAELVLEQPERH
jgi:enamine deaminase RidA (YjgF/YER057c/UK114 family)